MNNSVIEQRKKPRFDVRLPCQVIRAAKPTLTGETQNMSSGGALIAAAGDVLVGEVIKYFVTFPTPPNSLVEVRLRCVGKVVRTQDQSAFAVTLARYEFIRESARKKTNSSFEPLLSRRSLRDAG